MEFDRLILADFNTSNWGGHFTQYTFAISAAARQLGLKTVVAVAADCQPDISEKLCATPMLRHPGWGDPIRKRLSFAGEWGIFTSMMEQAYLSLDIFDVSHRDMIYFHTAYPQELFALSLWMNRFKKSNRPCIAVTLHDTMESYASRKDRDLSNAILDRSFLEVRSLVEDGNLFISSTTVPLCEELVSHAGFTIERVPILGELGEALVSDNNKSDFFYSGSLMEKGTEQVIRMLWQHGDGLEDAQFTIHFRDERIAAAWRERLCGNNVRVISGDLEPSAYRECINGTGTVLLPYSPAAYRLKGSSMFSEAMFMGKPVIVTEGTSMTPEFSRLGSPGELMPHWTTESLKHAVVSAIHNRAENEAAAMRARQLHRQVSSPTCLIKKVCRI